MASKNAAPTVSFPPLQSAVFESSARLSPKMAAQPKRNAEIALLDLSRIPRQFRKNAQVFRLIPRTRDYGRDKLCKSHQFCH
jgi:hypothetical protein